MVPPLTRPAPGWARPAGSVRRRVLLAVLVAAAAAGLRDNRPVQGSTEPKVRGVIISTHTDGSDWGSPAMPGTMEEIRDLGANWISIHPYAWIRGDGEVRFQPLDPGNPPRYLTDPIREAHALGLKILIKPHLGYWGSPFSWRGAIGWPESDTASWQRFFTSYREWVSNLAETCRGADGFVVGTELDRSLSHDAAWREVIAAVRARTGAALTYGANWTDYRDVTFWDALDVVGIQAYFPLADGPDPDRKTLEAGWRSIMAGLRVYAKEQNRRIVFTELGYSQSHLAPVEPWSYHSDGAEAEPTQARCMDAALRAVEREPSVAGVFLWKWFPNPRPVGRNFQLATPGIKDVIADCWRSRS